MEFSFDDSLFTSKIRELNGDKLRSYNAKICPALWFTNPPASDESEESWELRLKARADHCYWRGEYGAARDDYQELIGVLATSRMYMRRDVTESLARCHLKLDNPEAARTLAQELLEQATNEDHEVQYLSLLHLILRSASSLPGITEDISVLQRLIGFHPHHALYWWYLGEAYAGAHRQAGPSDGATKGTVKAFSCFFRVKLLLEQSVNLCGSFVQSTHKALLQQTLSKLEEFQFTEEQQLATEQFLSRDLPNDGGYYANSQSEKNTETSATFVDRDDNRTFEQRWFSWAEPWILPT